ncbi:hypothetical protein MRX96_016543 [Rhipicephalus microplus]
MEFPFGLDFLEYEFNVIENDLKVRDASKVGPLRDLPHDEQHRFVRSSSRVQERLGLVIDALGKASSLAQSLAAPVTTSDRLRNSDHRVYLLVEPSARGGTVLGLLKVGFKQLFLRDGHGRLCQVRPLCLLDFYVHQSRQRKGNGRRLFDRMTQHLQSSPALLNSRCHVRKVSVLEYDVHTHWIHLWLAAAWTGLVMTNLLSQQLDLGRSIGAVSHRAARPKAEVCGQPPGSSYSHAARPSAPARGGIFGLSPPDHCRASWH